MFALKANEIKQVNLKNNLIYFYPHQSIRLLLFNLLIQIRLREYILLPLLL